MLSTLIALAVRKVLTAFLVARTVMWFTVIRVLLFHLNDKFTIVFVA